MNEGNDKLLLTLLEVKYLKTNKELPIEWYQSNNTKLKLEAISEAINNDKEITEIDYFKDIYNEVHENIVDNYIKR